MAPMGAASLPPHCGTDSMATSCTPWLPSHSTSPSLALGDIPGCVAFPSIPLTLGPAVFAERLLKPRGWVCAGQVRSPELPQAYGSVSVMSLLAKKSSSPSSTRVMLLSSLFSQAMGCTCERQLLSAQHRAKVPPGMKMCHSPLAMNKGVPLHDGCWHAPSRTQH